MTSTMHDRREAVEGLERESNARIQRAIEAGGLPAEAEIEQTYGAVAAARNQLEQLAWRIEGISESANGSELPFVITLHDLGVIAVITEDALTAAEEIVKHVKSITSRMSCLAAIREEQTLAAARHGVTDADEVQLYYADPTYRESLPCSECGAVGGCEHFPKEHGRDG